MAKDKNRSNKDVKNKRHFLKDFKAELKKVIWPTPKQLVNKTIAVIVIVIITALIVFVLDLAFGFINEKGVDGIKQNIKNNRVIENAVSEGQSEEQETENVESTENTETEQSEDEQES